VTVADLSIIHFFFITLSKPGGGQQRVRAKLYGALLYYLQIASKPRTNEEHLQGMGLLSPG